MSFNVFHQQRGVTNPCIPLPGAQGVSLDYAKQMCVNALCYLNGVYSPTEVIEYQECVVITFASVQRETMYHIIPTE